MLTHLSIRDVVLIDRLDIEFERGLCVLTGETGAGKSIVLDALGLALGGRADINLIRAKSDKLSVSASFLLPAKHPAIDDLNDQDIPCEDNAIVVRRVLSRDGRGKAFINDQPVSVSLLRAVAERLVEVHGQFDTHGLLDPGTHLDVLDDFRCAKDGERLDRTCAAAHGAWHAATTKLREAEAATARAAADESYLRAALAELNELSPRVGEEKDLSDRRSLLKNAEHIVAALAETRGSLAGETDVESLVRTAASRLGRIAPHAGGQLDGLCQALSRAVIEIADVVQELDRTAAQIEAEPKALEQAEERLFALKALARKHKCSVDDLANVQADLKAQLESIDHGADTIRDLAAAAATAKLAYESAAKALHEARLAAALKLDKGVAKELTPLKLEKAVVKTAISTLTEDHWSARGYSKVTFEASTNPGSPMGPLAKIASGGELARFMLALKVVLAGTQNLTTLIFDEVDTGIGGATANAVGERLSRLAKDVQILVVTHSPQVAARATHHWRVSKATKSGETTTKVGLLDADNRREEIARMLAGEKITDEARAAASRLIAGAAS
jgi:DNA repair protein RecN (Recombination protein N)